MQLGQRQVAVVYLSNYTVFVSLCVRKWHRLTLTAARGSTSKKTDREGGLRVKGKARGTDDPRVLLFQAKTSGEEDAGEGQQECNDAFRVGGWGLGYWSRIVQSLS